ncbi:hypothetical protein PIB30_099103 [Stylosanthes scabra]|uniref:Uncharacterized protein n=1 Tax=Stylosanthes scabra TaxID=79078 RepID=A0ABU6RWZ4_9FABA|nr:hypothetical protein [Stylosanthes scabra]
MASLLKEIRQGQQATSNVQRQHPPSQIESPKHCGICSCNIHYTDECPQLQEDHTIAATHNFYDRPSLNSNNQGWRDNQPSRWNQQPQRQTYQNQQPSYTYNQPQNFQNKNPPYQQPYQPPNQQQNKELKDFQRLIETQLSTITDLLTRLTTQPTTNNPNTSQPSTSGGIPSQTLPNPKGSLNAISLSFEDIFSISIPIATSSIHDVSLMKFILSLEDDQENEIVEMEVQKESKKDECVMEVEDQVPTPSPKLVYELVDTPHDIAISSLLNLLDLIDNVPKKFGDPGPCLVDCKVGIDLKGCMCDLGACISIMPLEVYRKLNLGPLKESSN